MRDAGRRITSLALLALAACGVAAAPAPDFYLHGAGIVVDSSAPFALQADLPTRVESTVDAALAYWGGSWRILEGVTVALKDDRYVECAGTAEAIGCYDGNIRVSTQDAGVTYSCVEETALVHEIGHAVIGDPGHLDPRWMDFASLTQQLAGRIGYSSDGEVSCLIWASVWQHPPDR